MEASSAMRVCESLLREVCRLSLPCQRFFRAQTALRFPSGDCFHGTPRHSSGRGTEADFNAGLAPFLFNFFGQFFIAPSVKEEFLSFLFTGSGLNGFHVILDAPGIALAVAYGVAVPGTEGRAGMAALTLSGEVALVDEASYRQYVADRIRAQLASGDAP